MPDTTSSGETNVPVNQWTTGTLKIYHDDKISAVQAVAEAEVNRIDSDIKKLNILLDERSVAQEKAVNAALKATQEAINKSDTATEKRFEGVNEFRRTLSDQTSTFIPRAEFAASHKGLEEKVTALTDRINITAGHKDGFDATKSDIYRAVGAGVAVLGLIITAVVLLTT